MKDITVLFTCALGDYMESTIKCVKSNFDERKIRVIGTDIRKMEYNFNDIDKLYVVPRCDDAHYVDDILSICKEENVDVLIPTNTTELEKFEHQKKRFENFGIAVATAGGGIYSVNSKDGLLNLMKRLGMDHVPSEVVEYVFQAETFILRNGIDKTYCIKKLDSCGARGFKILTANNPNSPLDKGTNRIPMSALGELLETQGPMLMQEYLTGRELTVDMLCDKGRVLYSFTKENKEMMNGVAQWSKVVDDPYAEEICSRIVEEAKLSGNVGFDVKYSQNGKPFVIDCNPRLTATIALSKIVGINLPYLGIKYALKEELPKLKSNGKHPECVRRVKDYFFDGESEVECYV